MNVNYKKYLRYTTSLVTILLGFLYAESFISLKAFFLSVFVSFFSFYYSMQVTSWGINDYIHQTGFSRFKAQMIRYGRKDQRIRCYLICIFTVFGLSFLLSLISLSSCISFDEKTCETQNSLLFKVFIVMIAPSIIGMRLEIGEAGLEGKCPYCNGTFANPKERTKIECAYCEKNLVVRNGDFLKTD